MSSLIAQIVLTYHARTTPDHSGKTLPIVLYVIGFAMQVIGGLIVLIEVRDDLRAAKRIPKGGPTWDDIGRTPEIVKRRLEAKGWRIAGVVLIFLGATVGLAANLVAVGRA